MMTPRNAFHVLLSARKLENQDQDNSLSRTTPKITKASCDLLVAMYHMLNPPRDIFLSLLQSFRTKSEMEGLGMRLEYSRAPHSTHTSP